MVTLCRLCAKPKEPDDLLSTINDETLHIEQKLKDCCRWDRLEHNEHLPTAVCKMCYRRLEKSWFFCENVASAQTELLRLQSDDKPNIVEPPEETIFVVTNVNIHSGDVQLDDLKCEEIEIFDSSVQSLNKSASENKQRIIQHTAEVKKKRIRSLIDKDKFLSLLSANDCNSNGTIRPEKIAELKLSDWSTFPHKCWKCGTILKDLNELKSHITTEHPNEPLKYVCSLCSDGRVYLNLQRGFLTAHVSNNHIFHLQYCCFKCNQFFWDKQRLRRHVNYHNEISSSPITCQICDKTFTKTSLFRKHQQIHLPKELRTVYECTICKKTVASKFNLQLHMKLHNVTKPHFEFYCEQCGKGFKNKMGLDSHMISHRTDRPSVCDICGKKFKTMGAVKIHKFTHSKEKPFKCNECDQDFKRLGTLRRHSLIHTGALPHPCNTCDKRFRTRSMLTIHRRIHTGDRPYKCSECEYRAIDWPNCNKHMKVKHGISLSSRSQPKPETT